MAKELQAATAGLTGLTTYFVVYNGVGQVRSTMKNPCWARTLPMPPQVLQVLAQRSVLVQPRP